MFSCNECGMHYTKWIGKCGGCGNWNSIIEEKGNASDVSSFFSKKKQPSRLKKSNNALELISIKDIKGKNEDRIKSGISELDRVLGGGFVEGATILIGGDPGIGKSTLLLQVLHNLGKKYKCVYISGEESANQISMRSRRLQIEDVNFKVAINGCVEKIISSLVKEKEVNFLVVDSIQTMYLDALESSPGSISQIKASTYELMNYCKSIGIVMLLVGHVTKEGQIAGPKLLEHMVDVMLYFDGENNNYFRILRGMKNRFGAANEIGIFQMSSTGLTGVSNPSEIFLSEISEDIQGRIAFASFEGTRSMLLEIESLTSHSFIPNPRRTTIGWDNNRLNMILAILSSKCGLNFSDKDVYLSILGGIKTQDPAADLAVCISLKSAIEKTTIPKQTIAIGEVSLSGQVRSVFQIEQRVKEAIKLGFKNIIIPKKSVKITNKNVNIIEIGKVTELKKELGF